MAETADEADGAKAVPLGFVDLHRDTPEDRALLEALRNSSVGGLGALVGDRRFMDRTLWLAWAATVVGVGLIVAAERQPIVDTFHALKTAASASGETASAVDPVGGAQTTLQRLAARADAIRRADAKAIATVQRGFACLNGSGACPNGGRSPLQ